MGTRGINERIRYCRNVNRSCSDSRQTSLRSARLNSLLFKKGTQKTFENPSEKNIYPRLSNYKEIVEVVPKRFPRRISSLFSSPMFTQCTWYEEQWVEEKIFFFWFSSKLEQQLLQANRIVNRKSFKQVNRQC